MVTSLTANSSATATPTGRAGAVDHLGLTDADMSGRQYLTSSWFSSSDFSLSMQGGVGAILPIFIAGIPLGSSAVDPATGYAGKQAIA